LLDSIAGLPDPIGRNKSKLATALLFSSGKEQFDQPANMVDAFLSRLPETAPASGSPRYSRWADGWDARVRAGNFCVESRLRLPDHVAIRWHLCNLRRVISQKYFL
jgi:hypothetical protein